MSCTDNKDGSCSVEYVPYEPGTYSLNVTYGGHQVPGEHPGGSAGGYQREGGGRLTPVCVFPPPQGAPSRCR